MILTARQKNQFFLSLCLMLTLSLGLNAQLPDGTFGTTDFIELIKSNMAAEHALYFDSSKADFSAKLSMHVFIINSIDGTPGVSENQFRQNLEGINFYFKPVGIQFIIAGFHEVKEFPYVAPGDFTANIELITKHSRKNSINIYLVDSIYVNETNYYGFTTFPDDTIHNNIFIRKDYSLGKGLITQLGHFFGLLSTFELQGGAELVNGSNCSTSGDFICDTWADCGTLGLVNSACEFQGAFKDPSGEWYVPSVANFMTNGPDDCKCIFTRQQYQRMFYYYTNYRNYLR